MLAPPARGISKCCICVHANAHMAVQVYPFIGVRQRAGLLSASDFFDLVGMHPEIAQVASVDEIVGVKAVKAK